MRSAACFAPLAPLPRDGDEALEPYAPSERAPWDLRLAAHLLRRSGFGGSLEEARAALEAGPQAAARASARAAAGEETAALDAALEALLDSKEPHGLRAWWALRMVGTPAPIVDKLALFLHGHFASGFRKVQSARGAYAQCRLFLDGGLGSFRDLARAVASDAAMLVYLDGAKSERARPNENFARELMELFTLGRGRYTEADIREGARAFTGWRVEDGRARFVPGAHDSGEKTFLGRRGPLGASEAVDACIDHPACAPFLARKLLGFFAMPDPPAPLVDAFARRLRAESMRLGPALEILFASRAFFSDAAYRSLVKSPAEHAVGTLRALGGRVAGRPLADALAEMGQALFDPPNVKGWEGGHAWIHSATWIARANFAADASRGGGPLERTFSARERIDPEGGGDAAACVDRALELLVQGDAPPAARDRLVAWASKGPRDEARLRSLLHAVCCLPEYALS